MPRYELDCTDCSFQTIVVGEFAEALQAANAHTAEHETAPGTHFVNLHHRD